MVGGRGSSGFRVGVWAGRRAGGRRGNKPIFSYICNPELKNSGFYYV